MPEIIYGEQGSDEWFKMRLASIGGSSISTVLAKGKGNAKSKGRTGLLYKFCAEILTGQKVESYKNADMERGHNFEQSARDYYEFVKNVDIVQCSLIKGPIPRTHNSPDGLVGSDGGLEIKTHLPHVFVELRDTGKIDGTYIKQCQHFLWISERKWIDYVGYCPEMPNPIWIKRIERDEEMIETIHVECVKFLKELDELVKRMQ